LCEHSSSGFGEYYDTMSVTHALLVVVSSGSVHHPRIKRSGGFTGDN